MIPIEQAMLNSNAVRYSFRMEAMRSTSALDFSRPKTVFLCHNHKDEVMIKGLIVHFREEGMDFHADWKDRVMPEKPDIVTAKSIQGRIKKCDYFFFLATENSMASQWCAWEIGCADVYNKTIYIIPTQDKNNSYGHEYLDLYHHIGMWHDNDKQKPRVIAYRRGLLNESRFAVEEFK